MDNLFYEYHTDRFKPLTYNYSIGLKSPSHYHKQIELFYVMSGTQYSVINGSAFEAKKGDIIYCNPFDIHQYWYKVPPLVLFIGIPSSYTAFFNSYTGSGRLRSNHLPKGKHSAKILEVMQEFSSAKSHSYMYSFGLVNKLLGLLSEAIGIETQNDIKSQNLIQTILYYINDNYRSALTLQSIAEHCNYNKYYISRTFNSTFNCNLNTYINLRRIESLVEEKTHYPDKSITAIAAEVGFTTQRTFYRVFKEIYGCTPRQYFSRTG